MYVGLVRQNEWFRQRINLFLSVVQILRNDGSSGASAFYLGSSLQWEALRRNHMYEIAPYGDQITETVSAACPIFLVV